MHSRDPMGSDAGRVLLNGNAETADRFCALAAHAAGRSRHRDPARRARDTVMLITASWGAGERNDDALRRGFSQRGRQHVDNLGLHGAMVDVLRQRPAVQGLMSDHERAWQQLNEAYTVENEALTRTMRDGWARARRALGVEDLQALLKRSDRQAPGPLTRPIAHLVEHALASQVQRHIEALVRADDLRAHTLGELWAHFQRAAGLAFDPLWQEHRARLRDRLLNASLIALAGGSPIVLLTALRFFDLDGVMLEAVRRGAHVFGSSAGAMVLGQRIIIFNDRRHPRQEFALLDRGVGLARGVQPFPHVTDRLHTDDRFNLAYLSARFRHRLCVGLNAGSTLALRPQQGQWQMWSAGDEDLVVFGPAGDKLRVGPGQALLADA
ncbi:MAG: Type 1 glutamine amidotransferase-like domain-containing protein [Myxococcota bacterium]